MQKERFLVGSILGLLVLAWLVYWLVGQRSEFSSDSESRAEYRGPQASTASARDLNSAEPVRAPAEQFGALISVKSASGAVLPSAFMFWCASSTPAIDDSNYPIDIAANREGVIRVTKDMVQAKSGSHDAVVVCPGYVPAVLDSIELGSEYDAVLSRESVLLATARDWRGHPIGGVLVECSSDAQGGRSIRGMMDVSEFSPLTRRPTYSGGQVEACGTTSAGGNVRLESLSQGTYHIRAWHPGYFVVGGMPPGGRLDVQEGEQGLELVLTPAFAAVVDVRPEDVLLERFHFESPWRPPYDQFFEEDMLSLMRRRFPECYVRLFAVDAGSMLRSLDKEVGLDLFVSGRGWVAADVIPQMVGSARVASVLPSEMGNHSGAPELGVVNITCGDGVERLNRLWLSYDEEVPERVANSLASGRGMELAIRLDSDMRLPCGAYRLLHSDESVLRALGSMSAFELGAGASKVIDLQDCRGLSILRLRASGDHADGLVAVTIAREGKVLHRMSIGRDPLHVLAGEGEYTVEWAALGCSPGKRVVSTQGGGRRNDIELECVLR